MTLVRTATLCFALCAPALSHAAVAALDLGNYRETGRYALPEGVASEASAVAWNPDRNSLFVLGDEGKFIAEVSTTGALLGTMSLSGFDDTEGLTYVGNARFVITEERSQVAYLLTYAPGGSVARGSLPWVSVGPRLKSKRNSGIEGISYDPTTGNFVLVKEKDPQAVYTAQLTFATGGAGGTAKVASLFTPALGVADLADVQVLAGVMLPGSADARNLLDQLAHFGGDLLLVPDHVVERGPASAADLPQPGDARLGFQHPSIVPRLVLLHFIGQRRPRPDERHVAHQHVPDLREFIEARFAEQVPD